MPAEGTVSCLQPYIKVADHLCESDAGGKMVTCLAIVQS
jgi:hypothetical protein